LVETVRLVFIQIAYIIVAIYRFIKKKSGTSWTLISV